MWMRKSDANISKALKKGHEYQRWSTRWKISHFLELSVCSLAYLDFVLMHVLFISSWDRIAKSERCRLRNTWFSPSSPKWGV